MPGLDHSVIDKINLENVIEHIHADIRSDFILAPHYNAIFTKAGGLLWDQLRQQLRSGRYQPDLPVTMSVPKERWFTRPGSILKPFDRFVYQALIDVVLPKLESSLDRSRTFSHIPTSDNNSMFLPSHTAWAKFQDQVASISSKGSYMLKADISNYFERLPQHHLINLISANECSPEIIKLLEEMLSSFRERNSFGIIQGVFPSDVLGNFFLSDLDAFCEISGIPSARYVDDIYMSFNTLADARSGLMQLIERLRKSGLHLNEYKSAVLQSEEVVQYETAIDRLFADIRKEIKDNRSYEFASPYGFEVDWDQDEDSQSDDPDIHSAAVVKLMKSIRDYRTHEDQIEKFCLPILRSANSDSAVDHVLSKLTEKPHQTRLYFAYLSNFVRANVSVKAELERLVQSGTIVLDYQRMFIPAALLGDTHIRRDTVNIALQWLQDQRISKETRAMAAIFAARNGIAVQKRTVRTWYESEPSDYVRSAILYSAKYFPSGDRNTCKRAWGGHDSINTLICQTI